MYAVVDVGGGKDKGCKTQAGIPSRQGESSSFGVRLRSASLEKVWGQERGSQVVSQNVGGEGGRCA